MNRWLVVPAGILLCLVMLSVPSVYAAPSPQDLANELFGVDQDFGAETGPAPARLERMLSDQVLVPTREGKFARGREQAIDALQAGALNGVTKWQWKPVRVGLSADALHGFTAGFQHHVLADGTRRRAKYLAYWIRVDQSWRLKAYRIVPSAPGKLDERRLPDLLPSALMASKPNQTRDHRITLSATEKAFSNRAQAIGLKDAFAEFGRDDSINLGGAAAVGFVQGANAIAASVSQGEPETGSSVHWDADEETAVASSGDLGITFGFIRFHQPHAGSTAAPIIPFFTIWARTGTDRPWRYVAE